MPPYCKSASWFAARALAASAAAVGVEALLPNVVIAAAFPPSSPLHTSAITRSSAAQMTTARCGVSLQAAH